MKIKTVFLVLLSAGFIFTGINHLTEAEFFLPLMPSYLPFHLELVYISGVIEIALALLVLVPRFRKIAGYLLVALLIAVFPANIHMALHNEVYPEVSQFARWARLPLQGVLIWWVLAVTSAKTL